MEGPGLPYYRPPEPPRGPVREMWHVTEPVGDNIPFPQGVSSLQQWGATVLTTVFDGDFVELMPSDAR